MKEYKITTPEELRSFCIKENWFIKGTSSQYDKLFYANVTANRFNLSEITTIIWLCSDADRDDIEKKLSQAAVEYEDKLYGFTNLYN